MNILLSSLFFSNNRVLRSENLLHSRGVARSDFRPLPKIPYCCLPYCSSLTTEFYDPKTFFTHAALLGQTFVHCRRFPTAASRRRLGRVSVPMWPITLSGRLCIVALVSRYLTNKRMHRGSIHQRHPKAPVKSKPCGVECYTVLAPVSKCYPLLM